MVNAVKAESYLTVFQTVACWVNINIYAHKGKIKVYITAEKYMSEISHCLQETIKVKEAQSE